MRFALGLDHDLSEFHRAFRRDPLLGPAIRAPPVAAPAAAARALRGAGLGDHRAADRGRTRRRDPAPHGLPLRAAAAPAGLRDAPVAAALAARAPAELERCDLAPKRAHRDGQGRARGGRGRADLREHEPAWRRLLRIREIGSWTLEKLALHGQGRDDMLPAGDLAYVKLVGRLAGLGRRATEPEVREFFAPYAPYQGLAGTYALSGAIWPSRRF